MLLFVKCVTCCMFFGTQTRIVCPPKEKQDAKDKTHDALQGFRLLDPAQIANVEGIYECRAEKRSFNVSEIQWGVRFKIIPCPDDGINEAILYIVSNPFQPI